MSLNIDKAQIDEVLAELADEIRKESALAKAEGESSPDEESEGSSGPAAPPAEASAPAEESGPPAAAEGTPSSPEQSAAAAAPEGTPEHEAGEIEPEATVEQLSAEYKQLGAQDPEALKNHFIACKQAIVELMGAEQGAPAPDASAPPAAPPEASAPAAPPAAPPLAMKSEIKPSPGNGGQKLGKSETDLRIEALEKSLAEEKQRNVEYDAKLGKLVEVMSTPIRKSVKGLSDLKFVTRADEKGGAAKTAQPTLTKSEFGVKLRDKLRGGLKLSKSDQDLVAGFDMGKVDFSKVQHLIADAK